MYAWIGCGIPGHCQVFNKPEAMGKVIDAATMLGRTTGLLILHSVAHSTVYQTTHQPIFPRTPYIMPATLFASINRKHKKWRSQLCSVWWFGWYFLFSIYGSSLLLVIHLEHFFVGLVIVDCSATYDTVGVLKDAVNHGCCVVLANKKPLTCAYVRPSRLLVLPSDV